MKGDQVDGELIGRMFRLSGERGLRGEKSLHLFLKIHILGRISGVPPKRVTPKNLETRFISLKFEGVP